MIRKMLDRLIPPEDVYTRFLSEGGWVEMSARILTSEQKAGLRAIDAIRAFTRASEEINKQGSFHDH